MQDKGRQLSLGYKVNFGIAALGQNLIAGVYSALLPIFYQDYLGLAAGWIGTASLVYAIWNAINDPLFGYMTDNTRSRWGRRIPYMRFAAPFLALTFILVWFVPPQSSQQTMFWWMLVSMLLYDSCYTVIGLVYSSLLPEITESDAERNSLQIPYALFGLVGMLFGFMIPEMFRPKAGSDPSILPLQMAMFGVAIFGMLMIWVTAFKIKERPMFTQVDKPLPLKPALKYTLTSKSFLILVAANFMTVLMTAMVMGSLFYLADYVAKVNALILLGALFVSLVMGIAATNPLRQQFGVVGAMQVMLTIAGVGLIAVAFVPAPVIPLCLMLAGFGLAGPQTLTNILFGQVADEDEVRSGVRREGAFFGVNALLTKPAQSIALALMPFVLQAAAFVTRNANNGQIFLDQPESAVFGIRLIAGLIPGTAMLLGALILRLYPLRGEYLMWVKDKMLDMHEQKQLTLQQNSS